MQPNHLDWDRTALVMPDDLASDYVTHVRRLGEAGRGKAEAVMGLELTGGLTET